ncbi:recombinase family protein [Peptococcaceae bacterium 1198_IL3148]
MRVAIYCRVSSEDQQERGTIENQIEFAKKYCDLHQLDIVEWFKDDGITGTLPLEMRPEGKRALEDAKAKKFDLLLIYKIDRLGRSARVILNAVYDLEQHGIKIRSMTEPFDTGDPNGRFLLTILAGVADLERENILSRMWHGANRAAKAGKWLGGIVPYGYLVNDDGYLEVNNNPLPGLNMSEADVIKLIFKLVAEQGYSTIKVADYLNSLSIPTHYAKDDRKMQRGKRKVNTSGIWRPNKVQRILKNTTYKGIHYYGKRSDKVRELIPREMPAIVDEEAWDKAQQVLHGNMLEATRNSKRQYLLRRLIKCGECGLTYHGTAYKGPGGKLKAYYVCGGKNAYAGPLNGKCKSKNIPKDWIEEITWQTCVNFILNPGDAIKELQDNIEEQKSHKAEIETEMQLISRSIKDKETEKQSILDLYRKKVINIGDVTNQLNKIEKETLSLEQHIKELEQKLTQDKNYTTQFETAEEMLMDLKERIKGEPSFDDKRSVVRTLVKEITVNTKIDPNTGRAYANVSTTFSFSKLVPEPLSVRLLRR